MVLEKLYEVHETQKQFSSSVGCVGVEDQGHGQDPQQYVAQKDSKSKRRRQRKKVLEDHLKMHKAEHDCGVLADVQEACC